MRDPAEAAREAHARVQRELENALLRELATEWGRQNTRLFDGALRPPTLILHDADSPLGQWHPTERRIRLSRGLVHHQPWGVVIEVLKHEMAHQYVHEHLRRLDETAHGPSFRTLCAELGIDAAAAGLPAAAHTGTAKEKALRKVQRLLALAESDNPHEAEAALNAAHRLMRAHNIAWHATAGINGYGFRHLGSVKRRFSAHEKILGAILGQHFFVTAIWALAYDRELDRRGRVLEICGSPENLDIAEHVYHFLEGAAERAWRTHRQRHRIHGNAQRRTFMAGLMVGFHEKLEADATVCEETGLVWQGDADLDHWVSRRHRRLVSGRGPRVRTDEAWQQGRAEGRKLALHRGVRHDPNGGPRALTGPVSPSGRAKG